MWIILCGLISTVLVKIDVTRIDADFLNTTEVPTALWARTSVRKEVFIRQCYPAIAEKIHEKFCKLSHDRFVSAAIVGTQGVGKSAMLLYMIYLHLNNASIFNPGTNSSSRSFYYQTEPNTVKLFEDVNGSSWFRLSKCSIADLPIPLFVDLFDRVSPMEHSSNTIIMSSFQPARYKEAVKRGGMFIMPVWSEVELSRFVKSIYFHGANSPGESERVLNNFKYYGGSLRNCLDEQNPLDCIDNAITTDGQRVCERYFQASFGGTEDDFADQLVHRTVPELWHDNGSASYPSGFGRTVLKYQFASGYVRRKIFREFIRTQRLAAGTKFHMNLYGKVDDGVLFEEYLLSELQDARIPLLATRLHPGKPGRPGRSGTANSAVSSAVAGDVVNEQHSIQFPAARLLPADWNRTSSLQPNYLYYPSYTNLESMDCFCVMEFEGLMTLCLIQITTAEYHGVKVGGIEKIVNAVKRSHVRYDRLCVFFMVPADPKLKYRQAILDKNGDAIPSVAMLTSNYQALFDQQFRIVFDLLSDGDGHEDNCNTSNDGDDTADASEEFVPAMVADAQKTAKRGRPPGRPRSKVAEPTSVVKKAGRGRPRSLPSTS